MEYESAADPLRPTVSRSGSFYQRGAAKPHALVLERMSSMLTIASSFDRQSRLMK
jgi:hypothetical protein